MRWVMITFLILVILKRVLTMDDDEDYDMKKSDDAKQ